jgi:hypothetical protein
MLEFQFPELHAWLELWRDLGTTFQYALGTWVSVPDQMLADLDEAYGHRAQCTLIGLKLDVESWGGG